jgi:hypothetical protein
MKIIINEQQEKILHYFLIKEAQNEVFSFEYLKNIKNFKGRYEYCLKNLGPTQGRGSSRVIFQLSDNKVLKLALNQKGIAQNEAECDWGVQTYDVVPEIYDESDTDKYTFLVSEFVLPAKESDFNEVFGFSFNKFCQFLVAVYKLYNPRYRSIIQPLTNEEFSDLVNNNEDLNSFYYYMADYQVPIGDMLAIRNYGLTNRSGQPQIVLLDSGLTENIYNSYYSKK